MLRTFFGGHVWNSWEGYAMMQWYYLPRCCKILWRADQRTKLCSSAFWLVAWWKKVKQAEAKTVLNPLHSRTFWIMSPSSYNLSFWRKDFYPFQHQAARFQIKRVKVKGFMATHQILPHWLLLITLTMPGVHRFGWWVSRVHVIPSSCPIFPSNTSGLHPKYFCRSSVNARCGSCYQLFQDAGQRFQDGGQRYQDAAHLQHQNNSLWFDQLQ